MQPHNLIEVSDLGKDYGGVTAVSGISFDVKRGEILGFLGPNGAGKSTTMKMITGFLTPTRGTARVMGHDVRLEPLEVKRKLGYLPESAPSYGEMTVLEFLTFIAKMRELSGEKGRAAIARAVELCHLGSVRNQSIETLSKGYRQRVGFAQAILHDPPILILDEPTDGLDPNQKHEVRRIIRSMAQDKAVILSTHILEEVEAMCTRVIIIAGGKLLVDETPAKLLARKPGARMEEIFRDLTLPNQVEPERAVA
jgi:ABC-2 type transport system ATP-binding protein